MKAEEPKTETPLQAALANTRPLAHAQAGRPPLFLFTPDLPVQVDDTTLEQTLKDLKARGIALYHRWNGPPDRVIETYRRVGLLQKKLGMPIAVDGTGPAHGYYSGDAGLSHVDQDGKPFRDESFFWKPGCPFAIQSRFPEKAATYEAFGRAYQEAGLPIDYWAGDWEFDGPNEWKDGWAAAKRCSRCRENIPNIDTDFAAFQKAIRRVRSEMQKAGWVDPMRKLFPDLLIGNYGMNPHDGYRYWWDFYEERSPGEPYLVERVAYQKEQRATHRPWAQEFETAGYNVAMPVIYTWVNTYNGYTYDHKQYRWFRPMLREISSVGRHTPATVPIIAYVHWSPTNPPKQLPEDFEPMNEAMYQEALWHALLRGFDSFCMWSPAPETATEVKPVHRVYAAALEHVEFLNQGTPVVFEVPDRPGPVISALRHGSKLLVRRTDFTDHRDAVMLEVDGKKVSVPRVEGRCQVLDLP